MFSAEGSSKGPARQTDQRDIKKKCILFDTKIKRSDSTNHMKIIPPNEDTMIKLVQEFSVVQMKIFEVADAFHNQSCCFISPQFMLKFKNLHTKALWYVVKTQVAKQESPRWAGDKVSRLRTPRPSSKDGPGIK